MAEVRDESTLVWSSKVRTAYFFSAMRHFAETLRARGFMLEYARIGANGFSSLADALAAAVERLQPEKVLMLEPGDWRVERAISDLATTAKFALALREDRHFLISRREFADWASGYRQLRMEYFYRMMRKRNMVMMDGDEPLGGQWNYDHENRGAFDKAGPKDLPPTPRFKPDSLTLEAIADVEKHFFGHPGSLASFNLPVTRADALRALRSFIDERLAQFGAYQDAMWTGQPFLYHSLISAAINLKLLNPREVIAVAVQAHKQGKAPIEAVEGFVRQVMGWREFIRGVYWLGMPGMRAANHFDHQRELPKWYWSADTGMNCMHAVIRQTLDHGYAHHIQRLMVTGIWGLLAETRPQALEDWYLAVYVDAIEWVELPNVAGMALYADGGRFTSKPYIASGQYINRMSDYCRGCKYQPAKRLGDDACPFTTLYWNFLDKHEKSLLKNPRTSLMAKNISRLGETERLAIRAKAAETLGNLDAL
jgi:deoxyribodipyrimidine photolyase-related protein